jgi:hypothetical protein
MGKRGADLLSEYIDVQPEPTDRPDVMRLVTNLQLTSGEEPEVYASPADGEEGSPLAQALFEVPGLAVLRIDGAELLATRGQGVEWHDLIEDLTDVLRDFFL